MTLYSSSRHVASRHVIVIIALSSSSLLTLRHVSSRPIALRRRVVIVKSSSRHRQVVLVVALHPVASRRPVVSSHIDSSLSSSSHCIASRGRRVMLRHVVVFIVALCHVSSHCVIASPSVVLVIAVSTHDRRRRCRVTSPRVVIVIASRRVASLARRCVVVVT